MAWFFIALTLLAAFLGKDQGAWFCLTIAWVLSARDSIIKAIKEPQP